MRIGMTYDLKTHYLFRPGDPEDANAEFDHPDTVQVIANALEALGHTVVPIGSVERLLKELDQLDVELVFNIAEGFLGRNRESQVPILLELRGIPYLGSDGLTQALTLDKLMAKRLLRSQGIPTPSFFQMNHPEDALPEGMDFPLIVKPRFEGSSKGLSERSVVHSASELQAQTARIRKTYHQPAIAEAFISGTEYTVALVGNESPEIFPVVQVAIDGHLDLESRFYTHSRILFGADYVCPAQIDPVLEKTLKELALKTYRTVDCLDFGRVDFRVDAQGNPFVLELNPLPSLSTDDVFMIVARQLGMSYTDMIGCLLEAVLKRYGLQQDSMELEPVGVATGGKSL